MFGLDNPRHIAYHPALKIFGVAFNRIAPPRIGDYEESYSSVKIFDKSTFNREAENVFCSLYMIYYDSCRTCSICL